MPRLHDVNKQERYKNFQIPDKNKTGDSFFHKWEIRLRLTNYFSGLICESTNFWMLFLGLETPKFINDHSIFSVVIHIQAITGLKLILLILKFSLNSEVTFLQMFRTKGIIDQLHVN